MAKINVQYKKTFYVELEERVYERIEEFEVNDDFAEIICNLLQDYTKRKVV